MPRFSARLNPAPAAAPAPPPPVPVVEEPEPDPPPPPPPPPPQPPPQPLVVVQQAETRAPETRTPLTVDRVLSCENYKILAQDSTCKGMHFSVLGDYWPRLPQLHGTRIYGEINQWARKTAPDFSISCQYADGRDTEQLNMLLHPDFEFRFEPYPDGKPAPALRGRAAARQARERAGTEGERETVTIDYEDGGQRKQQVWYVERPNAVKVDQRIEEFEKPKLNRRHNQYNSPFKMLLNCTLPPILLEKMLRFGNQRLSGKDDTYFHRKTTIGEIIRFICYIAALCLERGRPISDMWRMETLDDDITPPPNMGKHGLSKNRMERLRSIFWKLWDLAMEDKDARVGDGFDKDDPWCWCRMPIDAFNEHYEEVIVPGSLVGPDESMSPFEGEEGPKPHQIPHKHFVPRKPKDTGAEINTFAEGQCGGIIRLDIERGKDDKFPREYEREWGYTTALNFRLAKPWLNSQRIYAGDSRFMGMDAIEDLHLKGMYGIGDVKTQTSRYPTKKVQELCGPMPGDYSLLSTELEDGFKVYAIGHRRGGEVHTFIASCGLTTLGVPQKHTEDDDAVIGGRPTPEVLNMWTRQQPKIDDNNRKRQHILAIEERFVTKKFPFRLLCTVLGICFVNTYEWYKYFVDPTEYGDFLSFVRKMSYQGMHNTYGEDHGGGRRGAAPPKTPAPGRAPASSSPMRESPRIRAQKHTLVPLNMIEGYAGSRKQICAVCNDNKHKTSYCCVACSTADKVLPIHPKCVSYKKLKTTYDCLNAHRADPERHMCYAVAPSGKRHGGGRSKSQKARKQQKRRAAERAAGYEESSDEEDDDGPPPRRSPPRAARPPSARPPQRRPSGGASASTSGGSSARSNVNINAPTGGSVHVNVNQSVRSASASAAAARSNAAPRKRRREYDEDDSDFDEELMSEPEVARGRSDDDELSLSDDSVDKFDFGRRVPMFGGSSRRRL